MRKHKYRTNPRKIAVVNDQQKPRIHQSLTVNIGGPQPEVVELEGRKHYKVPAVIIVEGILNGSHGRGFYPREENGRTIGRWNHQPITLGHPKDAAGRSVSAKNPEVINQSKIGTLLEMGQDDDKSKGFAYLDYDRTMKLDARIIARLEKGEKVELSTGLELTQDTTKGVHNGQEYDWVARDHEPDHLAILPDGIGACSVKAGAGLLANEAQLPEAVQQCLRRAVEKLVGVIGVDKMVGNEMSFSDVSMQLNRLLSATYGKPGEYWRGYVCAVYDGYVVYEGEDDKLYRQDYTTTDGVVKLTGDPQAVVRVVQYKPVANAGLTVEETEVFDKKKHIDSLIGNGFEEADRAELEKMPDAVLKKVLPKPKEVANQTPVTPPPPKVVEVATADGGKVTLTAEQIRNALAPEDKQVLEWGRSAIEQTKQRMVEAVKANPYNKLTDNQIAALTPETLKALADQAVEVLRANGGGQAGPQPGGGQSVFMNQWTADPYGVQLPPGANYAGAAAGGVTVPAGQVVNREDAEKVHKQTYVGASEWDYGKPPGKDI